MSAEIIQFPEPEPLWIRRAEAEGRRFSTFPSRASALRCLRGQPLREFRIQRWRGRWVVGWHGAERREVIDIV
jgi:hypothetical protein